LKEQRRGKVGILEDFGGCRETLPAMPKNRAANWQTLTVTEPFSPHGPKVLPLWAPG
jgi:hypothetical protein